jgi:hypothetical protein
MPAAGGPARRLTFHSASETPFTFSPDNKDIYFGAARLDTASNRLFPTGSQPELYKVPVSEGARHGPRHPGRGRPLQPGRPADALPRQEGRRERVAQAPHLGHRPRHLGLGRPDGPASQDHLVRRRGPQPRLHPRREGLLLPQRGERLLQRPSPDHGRRPFGRRSRSSKPTRAVPQHGRRRHAVLRLRRRDLHHARGRRAPQGRRHPGRRRPGQQRGRRSGQRRGPRVRRLAQRQGDRRRRPRRHLRHQRRRRHDQTGHLVVRPGVVGLVLPRRRRRPLRLAARRPLGHLRDPPDTRRGALLLRLDRPRGEAARREHPSERLARLFPRRQGAGLHRGPGDPQGPEHRLESDAHAPDREGAGPVGGAGQSFAWSPDGRWILFELSVPGFAPGEIGWSRPTARPRPST